jgi:pimeloyl-ACP methyl ester carboxylesterase
MRKITSGGAPRAWTEVLVPLANDDLVLVMAGDDIVQHAHTIALYEALPPGQLAIVPAASHAVFLEKPGLVNRLILEFLDEAGPPKTMLPIRRSANE